MILPRNLEAERATLGAAFMREASADYIVDHLSTDDYFRHAHKILFEAIRELRRHSVPVDMVTIKQKLGPKALEDVGGPAQISALVDGLPRSTNLDHYCMILRDLAARRALYFFADQTCNLVASGEHGSKELLADADRRLMDLQAGHIGGTVASLKDTYAGLLDDIEYRVAHRGELLGLDTGYASLNEQTSGWQAGDLTVIGARPSIGKTTLLLNTAVAAARSQALTVLIFSFEMSRRQLEYRFLSALSGVPLSRIIGGHIMSQEWAKLSEAIGIMGQLPIDIDDRAGQTRWEIRSTCRRVKAERGLAFVGIDYVQLIPGSIDRRGATRTEEVTDISRGLKVMAQELAVPVLLLSQLSRPGNKFGKDPRPKLTDLRESGSLEQDADNVMLLHRRNHREGGLTYCILEKQRNGPTGTVNLTLERDTVLFTDGGEEEPTPTKAPEETPQPTRPRRGARRAGSYQLPHSDD